MDPTRRKSSFMSFLVGLLVFGLLTNIKVDSFESKHSGKSKLLRTKRELRSRNYCPGPNGPMNFTDFDNSIGMENGCYLVPNHIHYIRWQNTPMRYIEMIFVMSAFKNQNPEKIFFHYNNISTFSGKYWNILMDTPGFKDIVVLEFLEIPTSVFGQELNKAWLPYHGGDVGRVDVLTKHGGIYLDNDVYVVKSLNDFRHYEFALGWDNLYTTRFNGIAIGSQILLAHKNARVLKPWRESFRHYVNNSWYYNGGERPAQIINENPKLAHVVHYLFGNDDWRRQILNGDWQLWKTGLYAVHSNTKDLFFQLDVENQKKYPFIDELDETNILICNSAIREMALEVYNPTNYIIK